MAEDLEHRLAALERRLAALEARIEDALASMRAPYDPQRPDVRKAFLRAQAARARAAKPVGKGRGSMSPAAKRRVLAQLKK